MATEAQKKAIKKYREKINRITVDFSPAEEELWQHIQKQPKKQTYIKDLIRADLGRNVYLIYRDSIDDACYFAGRFIGTEEEVDKFCDEYNSKCSYEWEEVTWLCVAYMDDVEL